MITAVANLRRMSPDDIDAALPVERRSYPQPWSEVVFRDELAQDNRTYLVAEVGGVLVGYGGVMVIADEAHITTLVVEQSHRGAGIGTRLVLGLVEAARSQGARSLTLEVRVSNRAAQRLYRRFGLAPVGVRKRYYRDEDALVMWAHEIDGDGYGQRLATIREEMR